MSVIVSLDPAQAVDNAALVTIRSAGRGEHSQRPCWRVVSVVALRGLAYADLARYAAAAALGAHRAGLGTPLVVVDATGIGRAVLELVRAQPVPYEVVGVAFTGGRRAGGAWPDLTVPKHVMVDGYLTPAIEHGRLVIPAQCAGRDLLAAELAAFHNLGGRRTGATTGSHDDTVTALAQAVYVGDTSHEQQARTP